MTDVTNVYKFSLRASLSCAKVVGGYRSASVLETSVEIFPQHFLGYSWENSARYVLGYN